MRSIAKSQEPPSLTEHRLAPHATYGNLPTDTKQILRESLVAEQRGLCCYCLCRISPDADSMRIEHWKAQANYPGEWLVYANLLGSCYGNEGQPWEDRTCDTRKGDDDLSRNPADPMPRIEDMVRFGIDGTIWSDNADFNIELNQVLNLNADHLKNNRRKLALALLAEFKKMLEMDSKNKHIRLQRLHDRYSGQLHNGLLEPYCVVGTYLIGQKILKNV